MVSRMGIDVGVHGMELTMRGTSSVTVPGWPTLYLNIDGNEGCRGWQQQQHRQIAAYIEVISKEGMKTRPMILKERR